ncbi:MAG: Uncharacterised protein [Methanobacteriota archaeon]|nr:MAG: Uncharacterised protein [Euryarchaeota archaeon]
MEAFAGPVDAIEAAVLSIDADTASSLTLIAPLTLTGAFSHAMIEAALVDRGMTYNRRFHPHSEFRGTTILIEDQDEGPTVWDSQSLILTIRPATVLALEGHRGDGRHGRLSPVAIAAALAERIAPRGDRTSRLRPFALAGNWLHDALDQAYDPVYTRLRDHLQDTGCIDVRALPEIPDPEVSMLPGVDAFALEGLHLTWSSMDQEDRARALSNLLLPLIPLDLPSTPRIEELGWHRIIAPSWSRDMASQIHDIGQSFHSSENDRLFLSRLIDSLVRDGMHV